MLDSISSASDTQELTSLGYAGPASSSGHGTPAYRAYVLVVLLIMHTLCFVDRVLIGILLPAIRHDLRLSDTLLGLMGGTAFALLYTSVGIPVANFADRMSRSRIIAGAVVVWSLFTALCGAAGSASQLFMARMGVGVGEAGGTAPAHAILSDYFPAAQRSRALSIYSFGVPLGSTLGMVLGAFLASWFDWRTAFFVIGAVGLPVSFVIFLTVKEPRAAQPSIPPAGLSEGVREIGRQPAFWYLSTGAAFGAMMSYGSFFWMPSFLNRSYHLAATDVALSFGSIILVGGISGNVFGGWLGDRLARKDPAFYALIPGVMLALGLPFLLIAMITHHLVIFMACSLVTSFIGGACQPTVIAGTQALATARTRAVASAMMMFINTLIGLALGTLMLGWTSDLLKPMFGTESLRYAIMIGSSSFVIGSVLCLMAWRSMRAAGRRGLAGLA